jgi:outer membrane protein TolC
LPGQPGDAALSGEAIVQGERLTLSRCIEIALRHNPVIVASENAVEAGRSRVGEARSGWYPQLRAQAGYNRVDPTQSRATGAVPGAFDQYTGSVSLTQNILDFGRTSSQVGISKYNLESARSDLTATRDTIVLNVKQAYYGVLLAGRNRDVAADVLKQFELHLDQAKGFYEVGVRAKIDVLRAEVDLSNAKLGLIRAGNALKIAWVTLNNAMGVPDAPPYLIEDNLLFQPYAITLEDATARALVNRPELKSLAARRQAAEANIGLAQSGHYPVLSGNAGYTWVGEQKISPLESGWSAGVALTVPLFSGFLTSHQVAEARSNLYVLRADEESFRQQVLLEVRQAYLNLEEARESISTAELAVLQAKENLDLANGRYAAGVGSPVEVSDAFATYVTAQANYTGALADYNIAQASIEKAMGGSGK